MAFHSVRVTSRKAAERYVAVHGERRETAGEGQIAPDESVLFGDFALGYVRSPSDVLWLVSLEARHGEGARWPDRLFGPAEQSELRE